MGKRSTNLSFLQGATGPIGVFAAILLLPACAAAKEAGPTVNAAAPARSMKASAGLPSIDARMLAAIAEKDRRAGDEAEARLAEASTPEQEARRQGALELKQAEAARVQQRALEVQLRLLGDLLDDPAVLRGGKADDVMTRRTKLEAEVVRLRNEAIRAYTVFVDSPANRESTERPRALIALARVLKEAGQGEAAIKRWEAVLSEGNPKPAEAAEAHLALSELYFEAERLEAMLPHCDAAAKDGSEAQRARALYLKSWALRGLESSARPGAGREAMEALREVVRLGGTGEARVAIVNAAESELVELYARLGDPGNAESFFSAAGDASKRLEELYKERLLRSDVRRRGRGPFID